MGLWEQAFVGAWGCGNNCFWAQVSWGAKGAGHIRLWVQMLWNAWGVGTTTVPTTPSTRRILAHGNEEPCAIDLVLAHVDFGIEGLADASIGHHFFDRAARDHLSFT
jgi:hypothetical protein